VSKIEIFCTLGLPQRIKLSTINNRALDYLMRSVIHRVPMHDYLTLGRHKSGIELGKMKSILVHVVIGQESVGISIKDMSGVGTSALCVLITSIFKD
jgi:hypothetical protein